MPLWKRKIADEVLHGSLSISLLFSFVGVLIELFDIFHIHFDRAPLHPLITLLQVKKEGGILGHWPSLVKVWLLFLDPRLFIELIEVHRFIAYNHIHKVLFSLA